jgi:ammonium transporter Rh
MKSDREYGRGWETFFFVSELAMIVFYIVGTRYEDGVQSYANNEVDYTIENIKATEEMQTLFPMWQQINVMVFIGFGFLKVFLKTFSWSAISFNFLCAAMACQWATLCYGFWQMVLVDLEFKPMAIDVRALI